MNSCEIVHEEYLREIGKEEGPVESKVNDIIKDYHTLHKKANIFISHGRELNTSGTQGHGIRLEKLKFEIFDGNRRHYSRFKEGFNKHIKPMYSKEEESFALLSYLVPSVKEEVTYLGEDIEKIWDRLDRKYGDENKLIDLNIFLYVGIVTHYRL